MSAWKHDTVCLVCLAQGCDSIPKPNRALGSNVLTRPNLTNAFDQICGQLFDTGIGGFAVKAYRLSGCKRSDQIHGVQVGVITRSCQHRHKRTEARKRKIDNAILMKDCVLLHSRTHTRRHTHPHTLKRNQRKSTEMNRTFAALVAFVWRHASFLRTVAFVCCLFQFFLPLSLWEMYLLLYLSISLCQVLRTQWNVLRSSTLKMIINPAALVQMEKIIARSSVSQVAFWHVRVDSQAPNFRWKSLWKRRWNAPQDPSDVGKLRRRVKQKEYTGPIFSIGFVCLVCVVYFFIFLFFGAWGSIFGFRILRQNETWR